MRIVGMIARGSFVAIGALAAASPAIAGTVPTPGPMLGAGAPALAVFATGYWLIRKRRQG